MIHAKKYCPQCNHRFLVDPEIRENDCPKCGSTYRVKPVLSDTEMSRGGFKLISVSQEINFQDVLLAFIKEHPNTCSYHISVKLRKPISTVRTYVRNLAAEGILTVDYSKKEYTIRCSDRVTA